VTRCGWGASAEDYQSYHDDEWGVPSADDRRLFEKLCLEGFQAGLSWLTILRRRSGFRDAFHGFAIDAVAAMTEADIERLVHDERIIRHRRKIASAINNARRTLEVVDDVGSLAALVWSYEPDPADRVVAPATPESTALAKDLKRRGFTFVGPTTVYAFMQAMGIVNDHEPACDAFPRIEAARAAFPRPTTRALLEP
jgi:DNA-3-methyladenine glycosylase I